jgi:hypothetical protein
VPLEVRVTDDYVAVVEGTTGIHGVGSNQREATDDFRRALREHHGALASAGELSRTLRKVQAFLVLHFDELLDPDS